MVYIVDIKLSEDPEALHTSVLYLSHSAAMAHVARKRTRQSAGDVSEATPLLQRGVSISTLKAQRAPDDSGLSHLWRRKPPSDYDSDRSTLILGPKRLGGRLFQRPIQMARGEDTSS